MSEVKDWMREHSDPASRYAIKVLDGERIACEHIKNACRRHFHDLEEGKFIWNPNSVKRPYEFITKNCTAMDYDTYEEQPIKLMDWQKFLLWSLHGWRAGHNDKYGRTPGVRRYEKVMVTTSKNAGKSCLFAAHLLYLLTYDGYRDLVEDKWVKIRKQNCVISASTLEQAQEVALRPAIAMMERNEHFFLHPQQAYCEVEGGEKRPKAIFCHRTGGRLMAVTSRKDGTGLGGRILHALHQEEITETNDFERWRSLEAGFKNSKQPLMSIATNPSSFSTGIAFREYTEARLAAKGEGSDSLLGLVFTSDEEDIPNSVTHKDWAPSLEVAQKSNPGLTYGIPRKDYLLRQIERAETGRERREVLRLNYGCWKSFGNGILSPDTIESASRPEDQPRIGWDEMQDNELWLGLDLSTSSDITALAYLWKRDGQYWLKCHAYIPGAKTKKIQDEMRGLDVSEMVESGWLRACEERQTVDYGVVLDDIIKARELFDLQGICYDRWNFHQLTEKMQERGIPYTIEKNEEASTGEGLLFVPHPQNYYYDEKHFLSQETSITAMEKLFFGPEGSNPPITIERNPLFTHAVERSIVKENDKLLRKIVKRDAKNNLGRIDVLIATILACGLAERGLIVEETYTPVGIYADPNFNPQEFIV